jgi:hypothetical protein
MTPRERRQAEVERAKAAIEAHRPADMHPTPTPPKVMCRWCGGDASVRLAGYAGVGTAREPLDSCEFHAIRALEAGGSIVGDEGGTRAAALIAKAAVLRVKRGER